jgi:hypothetical protein
VTPHLLLQKCPSRAFAVETTLDFAPQRPQEKAGLAIVGLRHAALAVEQTGQGNRLVLRFDNEQVAAMDVSETSFCLRVAVRDGGWCQFAWTTPFRKHDWTNIGEEFGACEGQWIGAKVGLFAMAAPGFPAASSGHADFHTVRFGPTPAS